MQVRANDVGYGNNKFTTSNASGKVPPACSMFPSIAPVAAARSFSELIGQKHNTVSVGIDGVTFEVGPDAHKAQGGIGFSRVLADDYCMGPEYRALVYGALHYMGLKQKQIDMFVLGLPMTTYHRYHERLAKEMRGEHEVNENKIQIAECCVLPQPYGGFLDAVITAGKSAEIADQTTLVIDPGYHTLDWIVVNGFAVNDVRSDAISDGGMYAYLKGLSNAMSADLKRPIDDTALSRIDQALRTATGETEAAPVARLFSKEYDLSPYMNAGHQAAREALNKMANKIGSLSDIDRIFVVGGSAHLFAPAIRERFDGYDVVINKEPIFANVRGFHAYGEEALRSDLPRAA